MKRNGFTLVELLAVIAILGIIGAIATGIIINSVNSTKSDTEEIQKDMIISATKMYVTDNLDIIMSSSSCTTSGTTKTCAISSDTLVSGNYIEQPKDLNDRTKNISYTVNVIFTIDNQNEITDTKYNAVKDGPPTLASTIISTSSTELKNIGNVYYFNGSNPRKNYLEIKNGCAEYPGISSNETPTLSDLSLRIIGINSDHSVALWVPGKNIGGRFKLSGQVNQIPNKEIISSGTTILNSSTNSASEEWEYDSYLCSMIPPNMNNDTCYSLWNTYSWNELFTISGDIQITGTGTSIDPYVIE